MWQTRTVCARFASGNILTFVLVNLFVGIKNTGVFQHSSFLAGGVATSAGLISVKAGVIYTLSPLSGHYR